MARPKEIDEELLCMQLEEYVRETEEPMVQEFCVIHDYNRQTLYRLMENNSILRDIMQKLIQKQEMYIVKNASNGRINAAFAIFRLKQRGFDWKDKQEIEHTDKRIQIDLSPELKKLAE